MPTRVSPVLASAMNFDEGKTYTLPEVNRVVFRGWLHGKGIRPDAHGRLVLDEEARTVLGVPIGQEVSVLNIQSFVRPHCLDLPPPQNLDSDSDE